MMSLQGNCIAIKDLRKADLIKTEQRCRYYVEYISSLFELKKNKLVFCYKRFNLYLYCVIINLYQHIYILFHIEISIIPVWLISLKTLPAVLILLGGNICFIN